MKPYAKLLLPLALLGVTSALAQDQPPVAPIPVEVLAGNHRLYFQMIVSKRFSPTSRFNFFSVAAYAASYKNDLTQNELVIPVQLSYNIGKGLGLMAGATFNGRSGFHPIAGPQYVHAGKNYLVVIVPSFYLSNGHNFEMFSLVEYRPVLIGQWNVYTRIQNLYSYNLKSDFHDRSYLYLRAGLKIKKAAFGVGANLDQYGPTRIFKENYGIFVRWEFQ